MSLPQFLIVEVIGTCGYAWYISWELEIWTGVTVPVWEAITNKQISQLQIIFLYDWAEVQWIGFLVYLFCSCLFALKIVLLSLGKDSQENLDILK